MLSVEEENKRYRLSRISEKIEAYYFEELRTIWQRSDRDWSVYCKKEEVSF